MANERGSIDDPVKHSDAEVEAVARALQRWDFDDQREADKVWNENDEPDAYKEVYRAQARTAITALDEHRAQR